MATVTIGSRGLVNADLVLVQNASFSCTFVHEQDDGTPIDHSGWTAWCRVKGGELDLDLSDRVAFGDDGAINLVIPDDLTANVPCGTYNWDLIAEDATGFATRIAWGACRVYDSWARDA